MSALGHKQTCAMHQPKSALPPNSDRKSGFPQPVMSALPLKADMCSAVAHVCFGPIADIGYLSINCAVRAEKSEWGNREAERTGGS
jgi:hypothetical protein